MGTDDASLVLAVQSGDHLAFHELVDRYASDLYRLAYSLAGQAADAEDIVQETLLAAFQRIGGFEGRSKIKTWLVSILVRQAALQHRTRRRRLWVSLAVEPRDGTSSELHDTRLDLAQLLEQLSQEHRQVLALRHLEGLSYQEMADILSVPRGTVESRLFRARRELAKKMTGYNENTVVDHDNESV